MIASERSQNIIVVSVIMITIVSSMFLAGNAAYYGGSYSLAGKLTVSLLEIEVSNIDQTNETINPGIRLTFNIATTSLSEGNVKLTFMGATVWLNDDLLSLTSFARIPPVDEQNLYPEFDTNYTMSNTATFEDRQAILDAETSGLWFWDITFRYSFIVFDERGTLTWRWFDFNTTLTTLV